MLKIRQLEEIESKLLEVSDLVKIQNESYIDFLNNLDKWLVDLSRILEKNRLAISGNISALRGSLISTRNGAIYENIDFIKRPTQSKRLTAAGLDILNRTVNLVAASINSDRVRFDEADKIALQLLAIASVAGMYEDENKNPNLEFAKDLLLQMKTNNSTVQGVVQLEGLVGQSDAIIFIHRLLSPEE